MAGRFSLGDVQSVSLDSVTTSTNIAAAAGAGKSIVIVGLALSADAGTATTVTITDGTTPFVTAMNTAQIVLPLDDLGWYVGGDNVAVTISAAAAVTGHVRYVVVPS